MELSVQQGFYIVYETRKLLSGFSELLRFHGGLYVIHPQHDEYRGDEQREYAVEKYQHGVIAIFAHYIYAEFLVEIPAALHGAEIPQTCDEAKARVYHEPEISYLGGKIHKSLDYLSAEQAARAHYQI